MTNVLQTYMKNQKENRLQIRVDRQDYNLLEKASQIRNQSLSNFVREASLRKAKKVIYKNESLQISPKDWEIFMEALTNPPEPSQNLLNAYYKHKDKL